MCRYFRLSRCMRKCLPGAGAECVCECWYMNLCCYMHVCWNMLAERPSGGKELKVETRRHYFNKFCLLLSPQERFTFFNIEQQP